MEIRERELIKIDRNGTKHFRSWKCPKCGGKGKDSAWSNSGWYCFKCGGTGVYEHIEKEYTPEYLEIMAEKNRKKQEKKIADKIAAYEADMSKAYREVGFNEEGHIYIVTAENTYSIKEDLKADGARWRPTMQRWFFTRRPDNWETVEVNWSDFYEINEYGVIVAKDGRFEYSVIEEILNTLL